ncbi:SPOR domain-containing protein [Paucibacter sp. O1-1]|nr:SPOR domain-containing protein [Paucibacter sp. O1-1]MDA3830995.1 SPOR domain-containing protein [Paucibacter sp. O1-1]
MDSQAKQRLIGAAVLIVLAIIFVPMFLSGSPPKQDTVTENLAIPPAPEREFQTRVVPADGGKATIPTPAPAAVPPVAPSSNTDKVTTVEADKNPRVEVPYDQPPPTVQDRRCMPLPVAPVKPGGSALPTATAHGRFAVHLGVFTSNANADALVEAARKQGISAYTETADVDGKPATRVRLGPFEDRATAESARLNSQQADAKFSAGRRDRSHAEGGRPGCRIARQSCRWLGGAAGGFQVPGRGQQAAGAGQGRRLFQLCRYHRAGRRETLARAGGARG